MISIFTMANRKAVAFGVPLLLTIAVNAASPPSLASKSAEVAWVAAASRQASRPGHERDWLRFAYGIDIAQKHPDWTSNQLASAEASFAQTISSNPNATIQDFAKDVMDALPYQGGKVTKWVLYLSQYSDSFIFDSNGFPSAKPNSPEMNASSLQMWQEFYESSRTNGRLGTLIDHISEDYNGTTTKMDADSIFSKYPSLRADTIAPSLERALANEKIDVDQLTKISGDILSYQSKNFEKINANLVAQNKKIDSLNSFRENRPNQVEAELRRKAILENEEMAQDAVTCASSMALIFGDSKTKTVAAQVSKGANSAIKIGTSIALYAAGIGTGIGAAAGILEGTTGIVSLFGAKDDTNAAVIKQIQELSQKISDLTAVMKENFMIVNERLDNIFDSLQNTYALLGEVDVKVDVLRGQAFVQTQILTNLQIGLTHSFTTLVQLIGKKDVNECLVDVRTNLALFTDATFSSEFSKCVAAWISYATDVAREEPNPFLANGTQDFNLVFSGPSDAMIADAQNVARTVYGINGGEVFVAEAWNPSIWAAGVNGYLNFASVFQARFPDRFASTWEGDLSRLAAPGVLLSSSLDIIAGKDAASRSAFFVQLLSEIESQLSVISQEIANISHTTLTNLSDSTDSSDIPPSQLPNEIATCPDYELFDEGKLNNSFNSPVRFKIFDVEPTVATSLRHRQMINRGGLLRLPGDDATFDFKDPHKVADRLKAIESLPSTKNPAYLLPQIEMCASKGEVTGWDFQHAGTQKVYVRVSTAGVTIGTGSLLTPGDAKVAPSDQIQGWLNDPSWRAKMSEVIVKAMSNREEFHWLTSIAVHDELGRAGRLNDAVTKLDGLKKALKVYMQLAMPDTFNNDVVRALLSSNSLTALPDKQLIDDMFGCADIYCSVGLFAPTSMLAFQAIQTSPKELLFAPLKTWNAAVAPLIASAPLHQTRQLLARVLAQLCYFGVSEQALHVANVKHAPSVEACKVTPGLP